MPYKDKEIAKLTARARMQKMRQGVTKSNVTPAVLHPDVTPYIDYCNSRGIKVTQQLKPIDSRTHAIIHLYGTPYYYRQWEGI